MNGNIKNFDGHVEAYKIDKTNETVNEMFDWAKSARNFKKRV